VPADSLQLLFEVRRPVGDLPEPVGRAIVELPTDERAEMHEHVVTPDIIRETEIEPAPLVRDEAVA
jgi:hypothetical protein